MTTLTIAEAPDGWDESRYGAEIGCVPCRETFVTEHSWGLLLYSFALRCPECCAVVVEWRA
jgi:hypothetical protein